jgi:CRISPR-associated protein Cas1
MIEVLRRYAYNHQEDKTILEHVLRIKDYSARLGSIHGTEAIRGIEGIVSREYFAAIAQILTRRGITFHGRNRRPPADPFNAVLSYCYTLLTNYCICAVQTSGLDVFLGFMHSAHHGGAALAFDFVEQFRQPIVDRFVLSSFLRKELIPNSFQPGPNGAIYLREEPKKELIIAWEKHFETPRRYLIKKDKICARELINEYAERLEQSIKEEKPLEHFTLQLR